MEYATSNEPRDYHYESIVYFHADGFNYNIDFDDDGTVGGMEILKLNSDPSTVAEISRLLKLASNVNWDPLTGTPLTTSLKKIQMMI
jgi:hypothetical protein